MNIMLGNLSISEIEKRAGIRFPDDLIEFMGSTHQANASNVAKGKWHCFDIPFSLVCGDMETATTIHNHLKSMSGDFKEQLQISINRE